MALRGLRVIEMAGLAPAPFCGQLLSDFGASVVRVDKISRFSADRLARGKKSVSVNVTLPQGADIVRKLCRSSDVLLDPFRPGVMEKLHLGPDTVMKLNPKLIYARLSGYGQSGPWSQKAGHDINYLALSGILSMLGRFGSKPTPPINLLADFAGGGLLCAFGILAALFERSQTGLGQIVDTSLSEGAAYVASWIWQSQDLYIWGQPRGKNLLDGGSHFYDTYETKDSKFISIGALEPKFYRDFLKALNIDEDEMPQENIAEYDQYRNRIAAIFKTETRDAWVDIFDEYDACFAPVLELNEAPKFVHNCERQAFLSNAETGHHEPAPSPCLSRNKGLRDISTEQPKVGQHSHLILTELGYMPDDIKKLHDQGVVFCNSDPENAKL